MMTADLPSSPTNSDPDPEEPRSSGPGWLSTLLARLGLQEPPSLRKTLELALKDDGPASSFPASEREMLLRLLEFGKSCVEDIMVPRTDIIAIRESASLRELLDTFERAGVSRIPVFENDLDDPHGMIHIKDLFRWLMAEAGCAMPRATATRTADIAGALDLSRPVSVAKIRRPILYVPPSMPCTDLLIRMQAKRIHMALVVDEYGGTDGLVTIEDLVEQIVGDIEDEHDEDEDENIRQDPALGLIVAARTPVAAFEEYLGVKLSSPKEDAEITTLGGLIFSITDRIPAQGERVLHPSGYAFEVLDANSRRIKTLRVHVPTPPETGAPLLAPTDNT